MSFKILYTVCVVICIRHDNITHVQFISRGTITWIKSYLRRTLPMIKFDHLRFDGLRFRAVNVCICIDFKGDEIRLESRIRRDLVGV